jgi:hypothetical protein
MDGIPPARDTDAEDVVWALQTAEALWKRNERGDAIVWLRRAAQAAGETNDDDRALALARGAAELTEWLARASSANLGTVPPGSEGSASAGVEIDSLLRTSQLDPSELAPGPVSLEPVSLQPVSLEPVSLQPVSAEPVSAEPMSVPQGFGSDANVPEATPVVSVPTLSRPPARVPTAAESHAGMLDPWSEAPSDRAPAPKPRSLPTKEAVHAAPRIEVARAPASPVFDDEVVTSAPVARPRGEEGAPTKPPPQRAPKPPPPLRPKSQQLPAVTVPAPAPAPDAAATTPNLAALDLSTVEAFADLPDDARDGLAHAARLQEYAKGDPIGRFGLAFVVSGDVHVMASGVPSQATTIGKGAVLRARGTLEGPIPLELVCASESCIAATWDEDAVEAALGGCPWVEDDLRASGDRVQAFAGATLGSLGQRLSPEMRASIIGRMTVRTLAEHEVIVTEGVPVPGILLVGAGKVELVLNDAVTSEVSAGQFVLPAEALSAGPSPASARAATGGALVLAADRKISSELFATEPLLLEIFAGW